jgi:hypothetical protein
MTDWPRLNAVTELALALFDSEGGTGVVADIPADYYPRAAAAYDQVVADIAKQRAYSALGLKIPFPKPRVLSAVGRSPWSP